MRNKWASVVRHAAAWCQGLILSEDRVWKRASVRTAEGVWRRQRQKTCQSLLSSVSLTSLCPSTNTYPIPSTPRQTWVTPTFCWPWLNERKRQILAQEIYNEKAILVAQTGPILAETRWEAQSSSAQKPRGEGKRKTPWLKRYERWKTFWLREQGRKRGGWHWWTRVNSATPVNHKSPWKTQCLMHCGLRWYTQLQNLSYIYICHIRIYVIYTFSFRL